MYHLIGIYKCVPPANCSATLYPELPVIVWFTLNRIFTHSSSKPNVWKFQLSLPCPRYNSSFQMYLPRAAFLKSLIFSVGMRRFKVKGCRVFLPDYLKGYYGAVNLAINYPSYL